MTKEMQNRRETERSLCSELVRIEFRDQKGEIVNFAGLLEDVSRRGLCISLSLPVRVGAEIQFQCDGFAGKASVEYCNLGDYSYLVGATFLDGLEWNESAWRPRHLLALARPGQ
ncbi:MAG: PilZ domain-containing protein [Acidobacteria bacterium]|nr:PilZ domain-containing protein [Acidobacteriota bacterium]